MRPSTHEQIAIRYFEGHRLTAIAADYGMLRCEIQEILERYVINIWRPEGGQLWKQYPLLGNAKKAKTLCDRWNNLYSIVNGEIEPVIQSQDDANP